MDGRCAFYLAWVGSGVVLIILAGWLGHRVSSDRNVFWILIDSRGRYSLTHFQIVGWTLLILSAFLGAFFGYRMDPAKMVITPELLALMGISAGSAVFATGVKGAKDASGSRIARVPEYRLSDGSRWAVTRSFAQVWLEEEGDLADEVINITKLQNFVFTVVAYVVFFFLVVKTAALPQLPESVIWLIGISHGGYVAGKMPGRK